MHVVGFAAWSGSGKTTLLERLVPALKARGRRVSVVKHAHHKFEIDHSGKDTWRHRQAGAFEVVAASAQRLALVREFEQPATPSVHALIAMLSPEAEWVLVEGFKASALPKVEVWRPSSGQPLIHPGDPRILAIATDDAGALPASTQLPVLDLNSPDAVAAWLEDNRPRFTYQRPDSE